MSCACNNKRLAQEYDRIYRLAKAWAKMEDETAVIYKNDDGSFGFTSSVNQENFNIVEFVTSH